MSRNPIRYVSRTFSSVMSDFNSDPDLANKPSWLKRAFAGVVDVVSRYLDAGMNQNYIRSIFSLKYMERRTETLGYEMSHQSTSNGILRFNIDPDNLPGGLILKSDLVALFVDGGESLQFESRTDESFTASDEVVTVDNSTDQITVAGSYDTGDLVRVTGAPVPGGLSAGVNYYVIKISSTIIKIATTLANAKAGTAIDITSDGASVHVINYALKVTCYQQKTVEEYFVGTPDSSTWQEFILNDELILKETAVVKINAIIWTLVNKWVNSTSTDEHYRIRMSTDGFYLEFGDGESFGKIPDADIYVSYAIGGGLTSNVNTTHSITRYIGNSAHILDVTNTSTMSGGSDAESMEKARRLSVILIGQNDLFLEDEYAEALVIKNNGLGGITHAHVDHNFYGTLKPRVVIVIAGGGASSGAFKTALKTYLESRSFGMTIEVIDATEVAQNVTSVLTIESGYTFSAVKTYYDFMLKMMLYSTGLEILDDYESNGVDSAIVLINDQLSESFTSADNTEVEKILKLIIDREAYAQISKSIALSDVYGVAETISGLASVVISSPSFPISPALNEITTYGTLTTTEAP